MAVRRRRPPRCSDGRLERMSDAGGARESAAGRRSRSGKRGSGAGEEWGCAGGVEEKETCSEKRRLGPHMHYVQLFNYTTMKMDRYRRRQYVLTCAEGRPLQRFYGMKL